MFIENRDVSYASFLRCTSTTGPKPNIKVILNKDSQILYSENPNELSILKSSTKLLPK